mgnify:CR=1 FL=1
MVFNYSKSIIVNFSRLYSRGTFTRIFRKKYFCISSHWESEFMLKKYRNSKILILFGEKQNYILDQNQRRGV